MNRVLITLGSNIDPKSNLPLAIAQLRQVCTSLKVSSVWESAPVGFLDQPHFCNAAVEMETSADVESLKFAELRRIEDRLGRVRDVRNKNAPRTIDLDIAYFNDLVIENDRLQVPDSEVTVRPFLAVPLAELAPEFTHPVLGKTLSSIAAECGGTSTLRRRDDIVLQCG